MKRLATALALLLVACGSPPAANPAEVPPPPPATHPPPPAGRSIESSVHVRLGIPKDADPSDDVLLDKTEYVVSYNPRLNAPNWAAWNLDRAHLGRAPRSPGFRPDDTLPPGLYAVKDHDYTGSGYDRGHLCPSADRTASPAINATTFVMTNVVPQLHELNAGPWEKLEEYERELAKRGHELYIVAGGWYEPNAKRIGKDPDPSHRVAVPSGTYKVIVVLEPGQGPEDVRPETQVISVAMPNEQGVKDRPWTDYAVPVRSTEHATGYELLDRVPRAVQDVIENRVARP